MELHRVRIKRSRPGLWHKCSSMVQHSKYISLTPPWSHLRWCLDSTEIFKAWANGRTLNLGPIRNSSQEYVRDWLQRHRNATISWWEPRNPITILLSTFFQRTSFYPHRNLINTSDDISFVAMPDNGMSLSWGTTNVIKWVVVEMEKGLDVSIVESWHCVEPLFVDLTDVF